VETFSAWSDMRAYPMICERRHRMSRASRRSTNPVMCPWAFRTKMRRVRGSPGLKHGEHLGGQLAGSEISSATTPMSDEHRLTIRVRFIAANLAS
jgi:hypothetical protein